MTNDAERAAFEAWIGNVEEYKYNLKLDIHGEYANDHTFNCWFAWQARAEIARREVGAIKNTWRHVRRGTLYTEIGEAVLQTEVPVGDEMRLLIYRGQDGKIWARPVSEFYDDRFIPEPQAAP